MTSLSSDPMAIGEGYIIVTKLDGKVIQEVLMAGLDVSPNGEFIAQRFKRAGLETAPVAVLTHGRAGMPRLHRIL